MQEQLGNEAAARVSDDALYSAELRDGAATFGLPDIPHHPHRPGHLINSKLQPPRLVDAWVDSPALFGRLNAGRHKKLVLVCAPTGSGKTTLLSRWHARIASSTPVSWLSLDESDAAPERFFSYLIGAARSAVSEFDAYIASRIDPAESRCVDAIAGAFVTSLARIQSDLTFIIDDFQWIATPALLHALQFVVHRSPQHIHWVIASRGMPDLNLSQPMLSDQLTLIGPAQLSFDVPQVVRLGRKLCGRTLSFEDAQCIKARTEGWVAGVKLALLALNTSSTEANALRDFGGSHIEVARYLGTNVLQEQSPELREFLIISSIVDRMNAGVCDALIGNLRSQALLEQLGRLQLFIQPLDNHQHFYRYHTLFLDFLRSRLRCEYGHRLSELHERASRWFHEHQLFDEALDHAFQCSNTEWRSGLVASCARMWLQSGEIAEVLRWSAQLPRKEIFEHSELSTAYVASLILCRRFDEAANALREAEHGPVANDATARLHLQLLHTMFALLADTADESDLCERAGIRSQGTDGFLNGTLLTLQAYAMMRRNRFDQARRIALRALDTLKDISVYGAGYAQVVLSLANRAQGDMKAAAENCEHMFAAVRGGRRNPAWVNAATALAYMRYEQNRIDESETLCLEVLPLLSMASTIENFTIAYITLARIKAIARHGDEAFQLLDYLHSVLESGSHHRFLAQVCYEKIRLCSLEHQRERTEQVARDFSLHRLAADGEWLRPRAYDEAWERLGLAYAVALQQDNRFEDSCTVLTVLRDSAQAAGYVFRQTPLEAMLASCFWRQGNASAAFDALNRGFALTHGSGFTRGVFDEATALTGIIAAAIDAHRLRAALPLRYLHKFHNVFTAANAGPPVRQQRTKASAPLEPLTDREIQMLRLLAQGYSNQQISVRSRIALSTAKWHLKNVFAKLDATTRTMAIARARELQLLE